MNSKLAILFLLCMLGTLNGSAQWQQVSSIEGGWVRKLEKIDQTIWAASNGGIYKSTEEGQTWVRDESFPASWSVLDISPIDDMIYVLLSERTPFEHHEEAKHLYRSGDGGGTWEHMLTLTGHIPFYEDEVYDIFRIDEVIFVVIDNNAVLSDDDGKTWHDINYFENGYIGSPFALGYDKHNILVTTHWGLYLSQDLGQTWDSLGPMTSVVPPILEDSLIILLGYDSLFTSYDLGESWQQYPFPDYVYEGVIQRGTSGKLYLLDYLVYVSEDNGVSWDTVNTEYYDRPRNILELDSGELLISTDDGFYTTSEQGAVWNKSNSGFVTANIWRVFISPSGEFFASTNLGHLRSTDEGESWEPWSFPQGDYPLKMEWVADDSVFIYTDDRDIYLATSNVQMYENISLPILVAEDLEIDNDVLYVRDLFSELLLVSHDFGLTWDTLGLPSEERIEAFLVKGQLIIIIMDYDQVWQSPDHGETWTKVYETEYPRNAFHDIGERVLITNDYQWYSSTTQGATWMELNPMGLPDEAPELHSLLWIEDVLFAVIPANGVYVSFDLGDHWEPFNEGLETLRGQTLAYSNDILALGTSQGSIWLRDISATLDVPSEELTQDLLVYPIPGNGTFNFILPESVHGMTRFELTDLSGRHVYSAALNSIYGSLPAIHIDLMGGVYLASLTYRDQRYISMIVIGK